jgi:hypothetical protein
MFSAISWICLPTMRNSAVQSGPIWLAYRPRSPTDWLMPAVSRKGWPRRSAGISSHTLSSLRQTGKKPSVRWASLITSSNGLGALGSGRAAAAGALAAAAAPARRAGPGPWPQGPHQGAHQHGADGSERRAGAAEERRLRHGHQGRKPGLGGKAGHGGQGRAVRRQAALVPQDRAYTDPMLPSHLLYLHGFRSSPSRPRPVRWPPGGMPTARI